MSLPFSIGYPVVTMSFLIKHQITHIIRQVSGKCSLEAVCVGTEASRVVFSGVCLCVHVCTCLYTGVHVPRNLSTW